MRDAIDLVLTNSLRENFSMQCEHCHTCGIESMHHRYVIIGKLRKRSYYGERCLKCGWSRRHPKTGKVPIEVEHIDGNWQNSRLTNLTLLCPNCHALTPTFRALIEDTTEHTILVQASTKIFPDLMGSAPARLTLEVFERTPRQLEFL